MPERFQIINDSLRGLRKMRTSWILKEQREGIINSGSDVNEVESGRSI